MRLILMCLFALVAAGCGSSIPASNYRLDTAPQISAIDAIDLRGYTVVDVRGPGEMSEKTIPGAVRVQYGPDVWENRIVLLEEHRQFVREILQLTNNSKETPLLLVCVKGVRATWAAWDLEQEGFTKVLAVSDGLVGNSTGSGYLLALEFKE